MLAVAPYYDPEGGGLERYAHAILSRLAARGHVVKALAFTREGIDSALMDGVDVERVAPPAAVGNSPIDLAFGRRVGQTIKDFAPDVVVAHTPVPFPAEMAYGAARRAGVPFVVTYHAGRLRGSSTSLDALAWLDRHTLERRMIDGASGLIAVSPFVRDNALARRRDVVVVIPPGVDTQVFTPAGAPDAATVLFVGPLSRSYRWKGVDVLIEAFDIVRRAVPEARLKLVGTGDRVAALRRTARWFNGAVDIPGRLPRDDLVEAYRRASVLVLPSLTDAESFGMVLAEANACGRPVVASDIGGIPGFVHHGENGFLARAGNPYDLAERITRLIKDRPLAESMGLTGRERVLRHHRWPELAAATERVLAAAIEGPAGTASVPDDFIAASPS